MEPPAVVYSDLLRYLNYGRPLWVPESSVELGDVGYIETSLPTSRFLQWYRAETFIY